ncbi:hypothetical protein [Faecalispora sporosphaeroides]|uniref:hypothetical protein n=2 Tax=Faecalispora sporosphaeroides TaxID=1549 RepID=UPI0012B521CC|nr:hypothetical protein [Faecalispora sporosphaeroides]
MPAMLFSGLQNVKILPQGTAENQPTKTKNSGKGKKNLEAEGLPLPIFWKEIFYK